MNIFKSKSKPIYEEPNFRKFAQKFQEHCEIDPRYYDALNWKDLWETYGSLDLEGKYILT
jgi:hypothetical protein